MNMLAILLTTIWGLAHILFGCIVFAKANRNDLNGVWAALLGGHPGKAALAQLPGLPRGPHAVLRQHGLNLLIIGSLAVVNALWFMNADVETFGLLSFVLAGIVFLDHNAFGFSVDVAGYADPVAKAMLYVANTAWMANAIWLEGAGVIDAPLSMLVIGLTSAVMLFATVASLRRVAQGSVGRAALDP